MVLHIFNNPYYYNYKKYINNNNANRERNNMKIYCRKSELSSALSNSMNAVTTRTTVKILEGFLLDVKENYMKITGTDTNIIIESQIDVKAEGEASFVVPAKIMYDIIRNLPEEDVILDYDAVKFTIRIQSGRFKSEVICFGSDEFPRFYASESTTSIDVPKDSIRNLIRHTAFSASNDEINGILTGVLCEIKEGNFRMVAVDAFRMAIYNESIDDSDLILKVVIPAKQIINLTKVINDYGDDKIRMDIVDRKAIFTFDNTKVTINTLNGNFIDYNRIIRTDTPTRIRVKRSEMISGIERAALMTNSTNNNMVKFDIGDDVIEISAASDNGSVKEKIEIIKEGPGFRIGFNSNYLKEILKNIDDEEIYFYMRDGISPCIMKPLSGDKYLYLVLPVRIN